MYDIIIDNLTAEALQKFLKISGDATIKKSLSKEALIEQTKQKIAESPEFSSSFKSFFNEIEKAGRKDFWFRKLSKDLDLEEINILRNNLKKMKTEGSDIFIPTIDDKPEYFNVTKDANIIEVKVIRKKIIKVQDSSKNVTEGDYLYVAYNLTNVRHVSYYKLDLTKNNKLLFGVDIWQTLNTKQKLKEAKIDIEYIFGKDFYSKMLEVDLKPHAQTILNDMDNVITRELKDKIAGVNQSAHFLIDTEKLNVIKKHLNEGKVTLSDIKTTYIDDDVRNNEVFQAAKGKDIKLIVTGGKGVYFHYSSSTSIYDFFRFEIFSAESRIKLCNDHIMYEDIENVFSKII